MNAPTITVTEWTVHIDGLQPHSSCWLGDDQPEVADDDGSVTHDYSRAGRPRWPHGAPPAPGRRHVHCTLADGTSWRGHVDVMTNGQQSAR